MTGLADRRSRPGSWQGARYTGLAGRGEHIGQQDGLVERKDSGVGILRSADHAHHGSGDGANGAGALVDFEDAYTVMVIGGHGSVPVQLNDTAQAAARGGISERTEL